MQILESVSPSPAPIATGTPASEFDFLIFDMASRLARLLALFLPTVTLAIWPPAAANDVLPFSLCAGKQGPVALPIFALLPTFTPRPVNVSSLIAVLFVSSDGEAWAAATAAAAGGLPIPPLPAPSSLTWLPAQRATFSLGSGPALGPLAFFEGWGAALPPSASWASHAVVYLLPSAPPAGATLEDTAALALGGALAARLTAEPASCALPSEQAAIGCSTAVQDAFTRLRLEAVPSVEPLPSPSPSRVPLPGDTTLSISGARGAGAGAAGAGLALCALALAALA